MTPVVLTPPAPVITLDEAKAQLRVDFDDEDVLIEAVIAAATAWLDGPAGVLGRALGEQELELRLDGFPRRQLGARLAHRILLPLPPLLSVTSIAFEAPDGTLSTMDIGSLRVTRDAVLPLAGADWPDTNGEPECVRVVYRAGWPVAADVSTVPAPLKQALLLVVGHFYANREAVVGVENRDSSTPLPIGVDALVAPYRMVSF